MKKTKTKMRSFEGELAGAGIRVIDKSTISHVEQHGLKYSLNSTHTG